MAYPGNSNLDTAVQQRILTAFKEAVRLHREGHGEEARTILRSIADVDASFAPAQRLEQAIAAGAPVDLAQLIGEVAAHGDVDIETTLAKARQAFAQRDFQGALTLAQAVLRELPGHPDARQLTLEAQGRMRGGGEVQTHLDRVRQALDAGLAEEARGFLRLAKNLDPDHPALAPLERRLQLAAKPLATDAEPDFEFEVFEQAVELPEEAPPAVVTPPPQPAAQMGAPSVAPTPPVATVPSAPPVRSPSAQSAFRQTSVAESPTAPEAGSPAAGIRFDETGPDSSGEFPMAFGDEVAAVAAPASQPDNTAARVQALLDQGQQEFDRADYQGAVDTWSRIYLVDVSNAEADRRIEQARRRREEIERRAEQHFYEAREAFDQRRFDDARASCEQVLKLVPQHLEAHDLLQRLETPAAPPPPSLAAEEDLFRDEFVPAAISSSSGSTPAVRSTAALSPEHAPEFHEIVAAPVARFRAPSLPLAWIGVGVGILVLVGAAALFLRGKVFSGGGAAVTEAMAEAEQLAKQGRVQEAVQLLQSLQGQAEGEQANRVNQRVLEYQHRLKAKAAPKPVADGKVVREALAAGRRVKAMQLVRESLAKVPGDPELTSLQSEITTYAPVIPALANAVASKNWESIRSLAEQVLKGHPEDGESLRLWSVATFNVAVLHLRKYQVAEGHELLVELSKRVSDPDAARLQQLAKSYLSRPADPRYQIYVSNVDLRQLE
ncbi:MAG: hypothetical protein LAO05_03410 [Acidobacteriia bacterium]|nr:hypothetical protein [Terriglobia bacterium]